MKIKTLFRPFTSIKLSSIVALLAFAFFALAAQTASATRIISLSGDLAFGDVAVGSSAQRTFTISNSGSQNMAVQSIDYPAGFSGDFLTGAVHAGDSQVVTVTFTPTAVGDYGGTVTVNCNKTSGVNTISISGHGIAPAPTRIISVSGDLNFGNVIVGESGQQIFSITNSGDSTLTVSNITFPAGFTGDFSAGTIAAGGVQNVTVTFSPTTAISYGGTVTISSDATSGTNTLAVAGAGIDATRIISLSGDLNFGNVTVGSSAQLTLSITNNGNSTLTISSIDFPTGFSGSFSGTIAAGGTTNVTVTFSPTDSISYSGAVTVNSDATSGVGSVNASGTGTPVPTPSISLSGDLNFGTVTVGSSAQLILSITNTGTATLTVSSISYPTGFSGDFSGTIAAGESTNVTVTFSPTDAITYSGTVTVNSDSASGANTVNASGTGTAVPTPAISLSSDLNFGNVTVGSSAQLTLSITNTGTATLTVSSISYPTGFSGDFSGTIAAGESTNVTVTFSPTDAIAYSGTVTVNSDSASGANTVNASGTGTAVPTPSISLSGDLNFGDVTVGSSAQLTLSITNTGTATLTVSNINYPTGFSGDFSGTIAAGESTNVTVTFSPTDTITYSGTVTVNSDAASGVPTVNASGTGTAIPTPAISLSGDLNFGDVTVGSSAQLTLSITNTGTANLTVSSISYPTGFSGDFSGTIAAGESTNVTVTFSPTDAIPYSGTVTVNSDSASGANTVNASGTGIAAPLPYVARKARFNGLFHPDAGVTFDNSGYFTASTTVKGAIHASIQLAGKRRTFHGVLSSDGQFSGSILRKGLTPLSVTLEIHGDLLSGVISDGVWSANLLADRNPFSKKLNPAPQAGTYAMTILGSNDASVAPTSNGVCKVTVTPGGIVKLSARLGDGKIFSRSTTLSANGQFPFYSYLYSHKGFILGWLAITDQNTPGQAINGSVVWFKPATTSDPNYPNGFIFETAVEGDKN